MFRTICLLLPLLCLFAVTACASESAKADAAMGEKVYQENCATCHAGGIAGAPKVGDKEAWKPRIAKGMETMVDNAIKGFQGSSGIMPARGGYVSLTDQHVRAAVVHMVEKSR